MLQSEVYKQLQAKRTDKLSIFFLNFVCFRRERQFNVVQLLEKLMNEFENHFKIKLMSIADGTFDGIYRKRLLCCVSFLKNPLPQMVLKMYYFSIRNRRGCWGCAVREIPGKISKIVIQWQNWCQFKHFPVSNLRLTNTDQSWTFKETDRSHTPPHP